MTWFVVKFDDENTVEAVPNTWYMKKKFQCYWPPEGTTKSAIINLIKNKHSPEANNWMLYGASILGTYAAVRLNKKTQEATDSEILCFIKAWLVRSKDRFNNNNKNKNITQTDERTPQTDERSPQTDERPQPNERTEN
ncbi:unnamed protein product [Lasius platythorax]|uniref:Uncharacterized protein n=1 Tax=Lasius platythorax TaxID=488582 RepID=A0AAV2MZX0_9HYME